MCEKIAYREHQVPGDRLEASERADINSRPVPGDNLYLEYVMPTAIVIDGAYFLRLFHNSFPAMNSKSASDVCVAVRLLAEFHIVKRLGRDEKLVGVLSQEHAHIESPDLYRIFFYDCPPLEKRLHRPVSKTAYNLELTDEAKSRNAIHAELTRVRKVALRLGRLNPTFSGWRPKPDAIKRWLANPSAGFAPTDDDFEIDVVQKGVDMRLGLDIAAMAFKKQVDQIVLVAGDADFVPVAKLARREGIDVILDPMWAKGADDLVRNVDGVRSYRQPGHSK